MLTKSYDLNLQAVVFFFLTKFIKIEKEDDTDIVNNGNLQVYMIKCTFLSWFICSLEERTIFDF